MIIDRFEGNLAVIELDNTEFINVPRQYLPAEAKEGDALVISIDHDDTKKRQDRVNQLMGELWKD